MKRQVVYALLNLTSPKQSDFILWHIHQDRFAKMRSKLNNAQFRERLLILANINTPSCAQLLPLSHRTESMDTVTWVDSFGHSRVPSVVPLLKYFGPFYLLSGKSGLILGSVWLILAFRSGAIELEDQMRIREMVCSLGQRKLGECNRVMKWNTYIAPGR